MNQTIQENRKRFAGAALLCAMVALVFALMPLQSAHAAGETIEVSATGLVELKVGKAVTNAKVTFTLTGDTYADPITPSSFEITGLPEGLTAEVAVRTSDTVVTVVISGTPTKATSQETILAFPPTVVFTNFANVSTGVVPVTGVIKAGAVESASTTTTTTWDRLEGTDRYKTMSAIVQKGFQKGDSDVVIIATGENYPDALAASGLAGLMDAPVVLTPKAALAQETIDELKRLQPKYAIIMGSEHAISAKVETALKGMNIDVTRVAGETRVETAEAIYKAGLDAGTKWGATKTWGTTAIIASSTSFADALSISSYAYAGTTPIFLTDGNGVLTDSVLKALADGNFTDILIVGSNVVVAQSVEDDQLKTYTVKRLAGADRYETSAVIAEYAIGKSALSADKMAIATGLNFPDALAGAGLCGKNASIVLLVADNDVAKGYTTNLISTNKASITQGYALGSNVVVSDQLMKYYEDATK